MEHLGFGLVLLEAVLDGFVNRLLVLAVAHVDEVDNHQPANIAQTELASNLARGLKIGFKDHLVHILGATIATGVDIDGDERLGFINDDVAAARQPNLA